MYTCNIDYSAPILSQHRWQSVFSCKESSCQINSNNIIELFFWEVHCWFDILNSCIIDQNVYVSQSFTCILDHAFNLDSINNYLICFLKISSMIECLDIIFCLYFLPDLIDLFQLSKSVQTNMYSLWSQFLSDCQSNTTSWTCYQSYFSRKIGKHLYLQIKFFNMKPSPQIENNSSVLGSSAGFTRKLEVAP